LKISKDRNTKDILTNKNHSTNANIIKITKKYTNMRKYNECLVNKYCFNVFLKVWTDGDFLISDGNLFQTK